MADRRTTATKPSALARALARAARILLVLLILGAAGYAAWVYVPPYIRIKELLVSGNHTVSEADILAAAAIPASENIISVNLRALERRLESEPRVASAHATRIFPSSLAIGVVERRPVACILVQTDSGVKPVLADEEGCVYAYSGEETGDMLVVSGIQFADFVPGQRLPSELFPFFARLGKLGSVVPDLLSVFSEIRILRLAAGDIELLLYPVHVPIPVRTQAVLDEKTLRSVILVLDILKERHQAGSVEEVDFRTGTVVYRTKEGQPG